MMTKTTWTFTTSCAVTDSHLYAAAAADIYEPYAKYTCLYNWDNESYNGTDPNRLWRYKDFDACVASVATLIPEQGDEWWLCALSEDGECLFTGGGFSIEKIPGAGVYSEDAEGWGYLSDVQQIGEHLYACGFSGQVYKRVGADHWVHMDDGLLQPVDQEDGQYSIQVINGPHENAIYAAGCIQTDHYPPRASFWNGAHWVDIALPPAAERITNMFVESEDRIWMCGANGTLLLGNIRDGFQSLSTVDDNQLFLSVCKFGDRIYLGSNLGLFFYDPARPDDGIRKVITGLKPELQDANIVDSVDTVLWSIGTKDIARFDGSTWQRLHHPDNPPIGGAAHGRP